MVYHTFLIRQNTPFEHEYCVVTMMGLVHLVIPELFVIWDSHNKPIFHRQSQLDAKMILSHRSTNNTQIVFRFSSCLSLNSCGNQFPAFWTSPRLCKRLLTAISITFNGSDNCLRVWSSNASKSSSSNLFGFPERSLTLRSKSPLLNRLNQSLHVVSNRVCSPYASRSKPALFFLNY